MYEMKEKDPCENRTWDTAYLSVIEDKLAKPKKNRAAGV